MDDVLPHRVGHLKYLKILHLKWLEDRGVKYGFPVLFSDKLDITLSLLSLTDELLLRARALLCLERLVNQVAGKLLLVFEVLMDC